MSASIELFLFGYPEMRVQRQPLAPPLPHKALALLAYLAFHAQPVGRETLAALLWPDAPVQTAKHSLRNLLSLLRKVVGPGVESTHRTVVLTQSHFQQIDVIAFEQGVAALQKGQKQGQIPALHHWQATLDLYRGDFLDGFYIQHSEPFEEWTMLRREALREQLLTQLLLLSDAYAATGLPDLALTCLERLFGIAPEHEAAYCRKIELLTRLGRRSEALHYTDRYRQLFAAEPLLRNGLEINTSYPPPYPPPYPPLPAQPVGEPGPDLPSMQTGAVPISPQHEQPILTRAAVTAPASQTKPEKAMTHFGPSAAVNGPTPTPALPPQTTSLVGRQAELHEITTRLTDPACRLLTLLGPGGMGKSRLALAVIESQHTAFADGVTYLSLASVRPDEFNAHLNPLLATLAEALAQPLATHIPPLQQLIAYLASQQRLLVIDNVEHMVATVEPLSELLAGAPGVKVLATSRERLNLQEEWIYTVGGLTYPAPHSASVDSPANNAVDDAVDGKEYSAITLFAQRASQVQANFDLSSVYSAVVRICQLVEGMPLALELAAAWVRQLPCPAIADEIARGIDLLTTNVRNVAARHRSMRAVFDQTWSLLSWRERDLLAKLAVFRGGFTRDAATAVADASLWLLAGLVDKSLLMVDGNGRYALHELLRQYITEQILPHRADDGVGTAHCHYYLALLAQQEPLWQGHDSQRASATIVAEIDNFRAAWHYAVEHNHALWIGPTLVTFWWFYELHGWLFEAQELLLRAIAAVERTQPPSTLWPAAPALILLGQLKTTHGWFQNRQGLPEQGHLTLQAAVTLLQDGGVTAQRPLAFALMLLGSVRQVLEQYPQACPVLEESVQLAHAIHDTWTHAGSLMTLGQILLLMGRYAEAEAASQTALGLCQQIGSQHPLIYILSNLGRAAHIQGDYERALHEHAHCLEERRRLGDRVGLVYTLTDLGHAARMLGDSERARQYYQQALQEAQQLRHRDGEARAAWGLGALAEMQGDLSTAQHWFTYSQATLPHVVLGYTLPTLGWVEMGLGHLSAAHAFWQRVLQNALTNERLPVVLEALAAFAWLHAQAGEVGTALQWLALVEYHPASTHETRLRVQRLQAVLIASIDPALVTVAQAQGHHQAQHAPVTILRQLATQAAAIHEISRVGSW